MSSARAPPSAGAARGKRAREVVDEGGVVVEPLREGDSFLLSAHVRARRPAACDATPLPCARARAAHAARQRARYVPAAA